MLNLKLALRNLLRNTRRTILTSMLIGFSLTALILVDALTLGMLDILVNSVTKNLVGEAQVHKVGFRENLDVDLYIDATNEVLDQLNADEAVAAVSPRVIAGGMVSSSYNVGTGLMYGIDAEAESQVTQLKEAIIEGEYLSGKAGEILIGVGLSDLLEVGLEDRIVMTLSEANSGELAQALFRVSGIFEFGIKGIDEGMIFVNIDQARQTLNLQGEHSHEIAIRFLESGTAKEETAGVFDTLNSNDLELLSWLKLNPSIASIIEISGLSSFIVGSILFVLAGLGVINSMFMSIYERIYEFGVAKAIGTTPGNIASLILLEAFLIAAFSCLFGGLLAFMLGSYAEVYGVALGEFEMSGIAIDNRVKLRLEAYQFIQYPIYVTFLTLLAALYPARFAAKIVPTEALQRSL